MKTTFKNVCTEETSWIGSTSSYVGVIDYVEYTVERDSESTTIRGKLRCDAIPVGIELTTKEPFNIEITPKNKMHKLKILGVTVIYQAYEGHSTTIDFVARSIIKVGTKKRETFKDILKKYNIGAQK